MQSLQPRFKARPATSGSGSDQTRRRRHNALGLQQPAAQDLPVPEHTGKRLPVHPRQPRQVIEPTAADPALVAPALHRAAPRTPVVADVPYRLRIDSTASTSAASTSSG